MQISFGRAIKVNTNLPLADNIFNRVNPAVRDVFDVMAGEDSTFLDEEKSEKVRDFLRRQIDDYSDKEGVIYRMVDENLFLFTGSDVQKVRNIDKDAIKTLKNAKTPQSKKEIKERKNSSLLNLIEDGLNYGKKAVVYH